MSKKRLTYAVFVTVLACSPSTLLARYNSSVPGVDLGGQYKPPEDITDYICPRGMGTNDPALGGGDDSLLKDACRDGVIVARIMAERYAAGEGRLLGCMDGLQQGISSSYLAAKNPDYNALEEARKRYENTVMSTAQSRATSLAKQNGSNVAESEIIKRFREVVNTNKQPNAQYTYPSHSFTGFQDGYVVDARGGSFSNVINSGWVSTSTSIEQRVEARAVFKLHTSNYSPSNLCSTNYSMFPENMVALNLWDYFRVYGQMDFKRYGWESAERSWSYYLESLNDSTLVFKYRNLSGRTRQEIREIVDDPGTPGIPKKNADGSEMRDSNGNLVWEIAPRPKRTHNEIVTVPVPGRGVDYYQAAFRKAFLDSYKKYYMSNYFGQAFIVSFNEKIKMGEAIGTLLGQAVAVDLADMRGYNAKYLTDSVAAFNLEWTTNYDKQWATIWSRFANQSQIELNEVRLVGELPNDIFQSGEGLKSVVVATNLGLASEPMTVSLFGSDLDGASSGHTVQAPASKSFTLQTPVLGTVGVVAPQNTINVGVSISGPQPYSSSLQNRKNVNLMINEVAEILRNSVRVQFNEIRGSGNIAFTITNPSSLETSATIDLVASLGDSGLFKQPIEKLAAKAQRPVSIQLSNLDPLSLIIGGIGGSVSTEMNGRSLHQTGVNYSVTDKRAAITAYLLDLMVNPNEANPGSQDLNSRIARVSMMIISETDRDIDANLDWNDSGIASKSMLGKLISAYQAQKVAGKIDANTQARINTLASDLAAKKERVQVFKRKAYATMLNQLNSNIKPKKKG
jgi:hypothetical protein